MKLPGKVKLLVVPAIIINSMLTGMGTAQASSLSRGFTQTCTDLTYDTGEIFAKCQTIDGRYQISSISLNSYIANHDGVLVWNGEGNYVDTSSKCMVLTADRTITSHLWCDQVKTTNGRDEFATLMLDEHIENVDGQLQYYKQRFYGKNLANIQIELRH